MDAYCIGKDIYDIYTLYRSSDPADHAEAKKLLAFFGITGIAASTIGAAIQFDRTAMEVSSG